MLRARPRQRSRHGRRHAVHLSDAPGSLARCTGYLSDLRHDTGTCGGLGRALAGTGRLHPADVDFGCGGGAVGDPDHGWAGWFAGARLDRACGCGISGICAGDADCAMGGLAVFPARLGLGQEPQPKHVDTDFHRGRRRLRLFRDRHLPAGCIPRGLPAGDGRQHLLRGGGGDRGTGVCRAGVGTAGAGTHR